MRKTADLIRERHDAIAKTLVQEQGKIYPEARIEVMFSADMVAALTAASCRVAVRCASLLSKSRSLCFLNTSPATPAHAGSRA
jgi:acyl-CoA reductase-like NAD-dependent aldehyde dehydrogenase